MLPPERNKAAATPNGIHVIGHHNSPTDSGRLAEGIGQVVAEHGRSHDRLLLLAGPLGEMDASDVTQLLEAAGSVSGLVRSVEVRLVSPPCRRGGPADSDPAQGESQAGPPDRSVGPATERFDMVIAVVGADSSRWVEDVPWDRMLSPASLAAFLLTDCGERDRIADREDRVDQVAGRAKLVALGRSVRRGDRGTTTVLFYIPPLPMPPGIGEQ